MNGGDLIVAAESAVGAYMLVRAGSTLLRGLASRSKRADRRHARNTEIARRRNRELRDRQPGEHVEREVA